MNQPNKCKENCACKIECKTHSFNDGCGCPEHNGEEFRTENNEGQMEITNQIGYYKDSDGDTVSILRWL